MQNNLVSAAISDETKTKVNNFIEETKVEMPFLISLTPEQKQDLFKPGDSYKAFINTSANTVKTHPEIMSGLFDADEFLKDVALFNDLEAISIKLTEFLQAVNDTATAAGTDALSAALEVYAAVKGNAEKVAGLNATASEMKSQFPSGRRKKKNDNGSKQ